MSARIECTTCDRVRYCELHSRAEHPPTEAKNYLKRICRLEGKPCVFEYRAGVIFGDRPTGQS